MKSLLLLSLFLPVACNVTHAQKITEGSLETFYNLPKSVINVEWDENIGFSKGITLEQFLNSKISIEYWNSTILPVMRESFLYELNEHTSKHDIFFDSGNEDATYKMKITVKDLTPKGSCKLDYVVTNNISRKTIVRMSQDVQGGVLSSAESLLTSKFGGAGNILGKWIAKAMLRPVSIKYSMKGERVVNYRFDYSKLKLNSYDAKEYFIGNADEFLTDSVIVSKKIGMMIEQTFISSANKKSLSRKKFELNNRKNSRFEVVVFLEDVGEEGRHSLTAMVIEKETERVMSRLGVKIGDGKLNDFQTLFHEQLEKTGEEFGDILADDVFN